jgi:transcriptional regulator with XRE-family HTH domain
MAIDANLLYQQVRERIKRIRTAESDAKLSQAELGEVLGLARSSIANLESGAQRASLHNVYEFCAHFHLELADFLPSIAEVESRSASSASTKYDDIDPKFAPVIEKLQKG